MKVAVIGGGWAGLSAAVSLAEAGHSVTLYEMAPQLGGRARSVPGEPVCDNGQHILIGAYVETLALMRRVGVDVEAALLRTPLHLPYPGEPGLRLPGGQPLVSFTRGVLANSQWPLSARLALLVRAGRWLLQGFKAPADQTVAALAAGLPPVLARDLVEPLCVAALNTPAHQASAQVFLRVLRDALFSGPGSADLLLPRQPLSDLLPAPAERWLLARGATVRAGARVHALARHHAAWMVDGEAADAVVLACSAREAARLTADIAPAWSAEAAAFEYQPIVTVTLQSPGSRLEAPMVALREGPDAPAQFVFDHGQLGLAPGRFAFVVSGAATWVARGDVAERVRDQALAALPWAEPPVIERVLIEKRATFACTPGLRRPPAAIAPGLVAAGDYVAGPYPATLEGAVRAGRAASRLVASASVMQNRSP
ncbi:hydroxysqualene dehydroxylase HpnE [Roseateles paludis]|uniref:Hydroxysqualene dehydroxylase HpnE n=1 Tax=Roseateles paludis TaxID=3145238 RepID=A0ABV0G552_9BURK